ncbi:MAG: hypothetical protein RRY95_05710 [Oscillospiraceae bacterium]
MKKLLALLLTLTLVFSLAACGKDAPAPDADADTDITEPLPDVMPEPVDPEPLPGDPVPAPEDTTVAGDTVVTVPPVADSGSKPAAPAKPVAPKPTPKPETPKPTPKPEAPKPEAKPETPKPETKPETKPTEKSLSDTVDAILKDVADLPKSATTELTDEQFNFFLFIDKPEGATAVTADAMIGSIAHSVVLMRLPDGADVAKIAKSIEANADPRKWICVEAEKTIVKTNGNLVLLVMSSAAAADAIAANFAAL